MTVGELLSRISSREFVEWSAYYEIEPFGEARADMRSALIACVIANANRDPEKQQPFEVKDFMLRFEEEEMDRRQTWQEQLAIVEYLNTAFGGKDIRGVDQ